MMNNTVPKVSVLMPVYNTEEIYLRKAIESILGQTYSDFEFIIINDGSTNNAGEVIQSYDDARIKYYEQENRGIAKTTNRMIDIAKGEYVALMDSDDISLNNRLAVEIEYLENHSEIGVLSSGYQEITTGNYIHNIKTFEVKYLDLVRSDVIPNPAVIMRRDILNTYGLRYNESFSCAQDYELWSRVIRYTKIVVLKDVLLLYRVRENSNSHENPLLMQYNERILRQNMLDFLTSDKETYSAILRLVCGNSQQSVAPHWSFWEKIFSVKNIRKNNKKYKILRLLGIKFKLKTYASSPIPEQTHQYLLA